MSVSERPLNLPQALAETPVYFLKALCFDFLSGSTLALGGFCLYCSTGSGLRPISD